MSGLLDAVGWVGDTLDKYTGGRAARGVLSGRGREALSILPFSDQLGITDASQKASGEDVLRNFGLTSDIDPARGVKSFLAEAVLDPSNFIGGAGLAKRGLKGLSKLTGPLDHLDDLGRSLAHADVKPALSLGRYAPSSVGHMADVTGLNPSRLTSPEFEDLSRAFSGVVPPESREALRSWSGSDYDKIAHVLRGGSENGFNPFEMARLGNVKTPDDVINRVVPAIDEAMSSSRLPNDTVAYRLARQLGDLNTQNAAGMIGQVVSDPSYMATTTNPFGRFYGRSSSPSNMLLDIVIPGGSNAVPLGGVSRFKDESELLLPRGLNMRVKDVQDIPLLNAVGSPGQLTRLDGAGKPLFGASDWAQDLHTDDFDLQDSIKDYLRNNKVYGDFVQPDEWMAKDWQDQLRRNWELSPRTQKLVTLEAMLSSGHTPLGAISQGGGQGGGLSAALRQHADFPMLRDFSSGPRIVGGGGDTPENMQGILRLLEQGKDIGGGAIADGMYSPTIGAGYAAQGQAPAWLTGRHERIHGIIDRAGASGNTANLPLVMRLPANMGQSRSPLLRGLGAALDEVAAQSLQYRAPRDQLRSGASFLFGMSPEEMAVRRIYGGLIGQTSPAAAAIFNNAYRAADPRTYLAAGLGGNLLRSIAYQGGSQGSP